jgi:phosphoglycolate phosphatase-like HAD superfamily hydrolase
MRWRAEAGRGARPGQASFSAALLLLFDIDGTLVRDRPLTHQEALTEAAVEVFGLHVGPGESPVRDVEPWGKTDRQILRDVLAAAGLAAPSPKDVTRWEQAACEAYARLEVDDATVRHTQTAAALERLRDSGHALALVTGNLQPIARRKLALRGLAGFFPEGQGGFGSDADLRPELVPIARVRAGEPGSPYPREHTVLIGDTPRDVEAAIADGVRCVGVTGTRFSADALAEAGASATVTAIPDVEAALAALPL